MEQDLESCQVSGGAGSGELPRPKCLVEQNLESFQVSGGAGSGELPSVWRAAECLVEPIDIYLIRSSGRVIILPGWVPHNHNQQKIMKCKQIVYRAVLPHLQ